MASIPLRQRIRSAVGAVVRRRLVSARDQFLARAQHDCEQVQCETLRRILTLNSDSEFSRRYGLSPDLSVAGFQQRFSVSGYDAFRPAIEQMVAGNHRALLGSRNKLLMYALTSGTTDRAKRIPITQQFVNDYRRGWQHWGISVHEHHPQLKLLKMVQLNSRHEVNRTPNGVPCGNISGLVTSMQSRIIRKLYSVPAAVTLVDDPHQRQQIAARFAIADQWVGMFVTANPSSLISLLNVADRNAEQIIRDIFGGRISNSGLPSSLRKQLEAKVRPNPERARVVERLFNEDSTFLPNKVWPNCCVLGVWTGGSVSAYLPELRRRFPGLPIRDHGLHASEGRMTIPIHDGFAAGILDIDSHYFEFIPEGELDSDDPVVLGAHELLEGQNYGILLTTASGLYRYNIHDVVRCCGYYGSTPLLEFLHKAAHISSITGEKITESQVVKAVQEALAEVTGTKHAGGVFTMTPVWGSPPGYQLYISQSLTDQQLADLAPAADRRLCDHNCEYRDKRRSGRLNELTCRFLEEAQWQRLTDYRLRRAGGSQEQYKHPFLLADPQFEGRLQNAITSV